MKYNQMNKKSNPSCAVGNPSARRSQRRINKLLDKNISEYQIPNPYRNSRAHPYLPRNLSKQLSRMNNFSIRTLQILQFHQPSAREEVNQLLIKMRVAVQRQSEELTTYVSLMAKKMKRYSEPTIDDEVSKNFEKYDVDDLNHSEFLPKDSENSIELRGQSQESDNLPPHHSDGASIMSDNYEVDKLIFSTGQHLLMHPVDEPIEFYDM